jgi:catechol 2,3-dioxygenase
MSTVLQTHQQSEVSLPATLRMGAVSLTVADLDRSVRWYQTALGLKVHQLEPPVARLGDGTTTVLVLTEGPEAAQPGRHAGLYHYALLYPSREDLARAALRLGVIRTPVQGASDHGTHEAIYLPDADGLGIELAADRPRELWPTPEAKFSRGGPQPLDFESLLATVDGEASPSDVAPGLRVGHVHLHVGSIERGLAFYRDTVGFDVWALISTAAFVSAGGYHHHLGFNSWLGEGVPPQPHDVVGLRHWTIELESETEVAVVRARVEGAGAPLEAVDGGFVTSDPFQIPLRVVKAGS